MCQQVYLVDVCTVACTSEIIFEPRHEKTNILVSDLVQHKPGCTAIEDA